MFFRYPVQTILSTLNRYGLDISTSIILSTVLAKFQRLFYSLLTLHAILKKVYQYINIMLMFSTSSIKYKLLDY